MTKGVLWEWDMAKQVVDADNAPKKKIRVPVFGKFLTSLRLALRPGRMTSVEWVARQLRQANVVVDDTTLRGYEYGWVDRPDPVVLLGLARIYKTDLHVLIAVLDANRQNKELSEFELERVLREASDRSRVETAAADRLEEIKGRLRQVRADIGELIGEGHESRGPTAIPRDVAPASSSRDRGRSRETDR